jgi:hypothetical protein
LAEQLLDHLVVSSDLKLRLPTTRAFGLSAFTPALSALDGFRRGARTALPKGCAYETGIHLFLHRKSRVQGRPVK